MKPNEVCSCQHIGKSSITFSSDIYIRSYASAGSQKESEGPLGAYFDDISTDPLFGCDNWETAESEIQKRTSLLAIKTANLSCSDIQMAFAGDLLAQTVASSFGSANLGIPFYGLYGACSTMGEALSLASVFIASGSAQNILCTTSSHFGSAEKEFRFPLAYGNQRPLSSTWTVTGGGSCIVSSSVNPSSNISVKITGITTGRIIDSGLKDSLNMGGCMAPAACDTIARHFHDFQCSPSEYDLIVTGDLGSIGQEILLKLLKEKGFSIEKQHQDCGLLIYDSLKQDTHSGGSGCGCCAAVLCTYLIPGILSGKWHKILFVPTGALLSKVSFNEGISIPGIAHAVILEYAK